ncbi:hypothetical protein [Streptomyces sp. NPDC059063]
MVVRNLQAEYLEKAKGLPALGSLQAPKINLGELDSLQRTLTMLQETGLV